MKFKIGLILLFFSFKILAQQQSQAKFNYKATYQLDYQEYSTDENSLKSETVVLYVNLGIQPLSCDSQSEIVVLSINLDPQPLNCES